MPPILKLQAVGDKFREAILSVGETKEECIIQDEQGRPVAVIVPYERYESFQIYWRQREANFAVLDRIDKKMKGYDPDFIESQIEKAVEEVKAEARAKRQSS